MIKSTNAKLKIVSQALFFFFILIVGTWTGNRLMREFKTGLFLPSTPQKKLMDAVSLDIEHLGKSKTLPPGFYDLSKVGLVTQSKSLREAFDRYPLNLHRTPQGKYTLQIFADTLQEGGVMIQYDLVELKSGNTIWELGRTFPQSL